MNDTIGSRIFKFRKEKGITQEELANRLGVSSQAVSKWENDNSCPDITLLSKLAQVLGVSTDAILSGKNEEVKLVPVAQRKNIDEMILRIYVHSTDGDRVKINLPMALVKVGIEIGMDFAPGMGTGNAMKDIDFQKVFALVEQGVIGKLVEVQSVDGDLVEIYVE